jgi:polyhydroxyalkanoate synthesis regulator phasin
MSLFRKIANSVVDDMVESGEMNKIVVTAMSCMTNLSKSV